MRKWLAIAGLAFSLIFIAALFWFSEWRYSLPTPVPASYQAPKKGDYINLGGNLKTAENIPVFLHFFNPDCPCSRFNIAHFKTLVSEYGDRVNFAVVVITKDQTYTSKKIKEKYGLSIPVFSDTAIAGSCGVYSTPQAVLLDGGHRLYYRGNYNRSRYCTDSKTNYAQIAIDSLLGSGEQPVFNQYALTAYGCSLPGCKK